MNRNSPAPGFSQTPRFDVAIVGGGIVGLATPELERDVREFFASRKIDLGGKTLDQYLEQLRIAVVFRERVLGRLPEDLAG